MTDFDINKLKQDMNFIEEGITISNVSKKKTFELSNETKVSKKIKNLRYFLKKKRNMMFKHAPSQVFLRSR
jgi:hypothetical protein